TRTGDFPPSSNETILIVSAAFVIMPFPTEVLPVKETIRTFSCVANSSPVSLLSPITKEATPYGESVSANNSDKACNVIRLILAGLITTALLASSAGCNRQSVTNRGKFQRTINETTPSGYLTAMVCNCPSPYITPLFFTSSNLAQ